MAGFLGRGRVIIVFDYVIRCSHTAVACAESRSRLPSLESSLMSWLASSRPYFLLLNSTRRQLFSFSFRPRFPRDLSAPQGLRNARLQSGAVPSFREQVARTSPVPCFADAVKHPQIGKHVIVC